MFVPTNLRYSAVCDYFARHGADGKTLTHLGIDPQSPPRGKARMAQSDQAW
ncbi:MAG: hypothetical protein WBD34_22820 [Burkholderiaceae bacterium]